MSCVDKDCCASCCCCLVFLVVIFGVIGILFPPLSSSDFQLHNVQLIPKAYRLNDPLEVSYSISFNLNRKIDLERCVFSLLPVHWDNTSSKYYSMVRQSFDFKNDGIFKVHPVVLSGSDEDEHEQGMNRLPSRLILSLQCSSSIVAQQVIPLSTALFTQELIEEAKQVKISPVNILIFGEVGAGKSTLINSMFTCLNREVVQVAQVSGDSVHVTKLASRFHLYAFSTTTKQTQDLNITLTDTVGVSTNNYDDDKSISFLLQGGIPDILQEEKLEMLKHELVRWDTWLYQTRKVMNMKQGEENLLLKFADAISKEEQERLKSALSAYSKDFENWDTYYKDRLSVLKFKQDNKNSLEDMQKDYKKHYKELEELKKDIHQRKKALAENRAEQSKKLGSVMHGMHSVIFLVTHSTIQSEQSDLLKSLRKVLKIIKHYGYFPVIGVTKLQTRDVLLARRQTAHTLGVSLSNVIAVFANLENSQKNAFVDKRSCDLLLTSVKRARQFVLKARKDEL